MIWGVCMDELLDTFDINGNFMGVKTREFCHNGNPGVYHKPVWIWIVNSNKEILVQKRSMMKKTSPGKWDMPAAGHVSAGESCIQGCIRETTEELGLSVEEKDFIFLKEFVNQRGWELVQVYLLKVDVDVKDIKIQEEEVEEVKWLNYEDFIKLLYSDEFCNHDKMYKDWVASVLK